MEELELMHGSNPYSAPTSLAPLKPVREKLVSPLATRWQRFFGYLIDTLIIIVAFVPLAYVVDNFTWLVFPELMGGLSDLGYEIFSTLLALAIASLVFLCINGYLLAKNGQTVGKMVMKTRIVSNRGELVPMPSLFLRRYLFLWCITSIPVIGQIINLANCFAIFRANHKCCHDDWAGTKVISTMNPKNSRKLPVKLEPFADVSQ